MKKYLFALLIVPLFTAAQYNLSIPEIKYPVQPTMWGLFFEDINRGADGGIYAELVKNRSFDFPEAFMGWSTEPSRRKYDRHEVFQMINQSAVNANNPKYLQVRCNGMEKVSLSNESFGGLTVKKGLPYHLTIVCRVKKAGIVLNASVVNASGRSVGLTTVKPDAEKKDWQTLTSTILATDTTVKGKLQIGFEGAGQLDIDRISLLPADTWKGRQPGLRNDLIQKLADIRPGFLRFPGGCIVEGKDLATRYQWKNTIGSLEERRLIPNQWQDGAAGPALKDYFQSFGVGFMEYFQLCEDLKTEPMPILNCGLSCQFDAGEVDGEVDVYVQDALDLIEFANGDAVGTVWGKRRAELGHPAPFGLKLLGIGNENWGPQYVQRLELFTRAIKARYPEIQLIASTGYTPNAQFGYMDSVLRKMKVDIIDEHYYQTPDWFLKNASMYDGYDRKGPKIFIGEYACHSIRIGNKDNKNTLLCALAEAAWMTGLERNADVVTMAAYAPLFAHVKDWQWTPNLIWFDNLKSYATPSYHVQQLFSLNKGTEVVPLTLDNAPIAGQDSVWASAVIDRQKRELIVKIVNPSVLAKSRTISLSRELKGKTGELIVLAGERASDENSLLRPDLISPATKPLKVDGDKVAVQLAPLSFNVVKIRY